MDTFPVTLGRLESQHKEWSKRTNTIEQPLISPGKEGARMALASQSLYRQLFTFESKLWTLILVHFSAS